MIQTGQQSGGAGCALRYADRQRVPDLGRGVTSTPAGIIGVGLPGAGVIVWHNLNRAGRL